MDVSVVLAVMAGIALAAACGLRAFLPLLAISLAARFGALRLDPGLAWLGGNPALIALGVAAALEIAADKIPVLDHALDVLATALRPIAAALAALGVLPHLAPPLAAVVAVLAGAGAFGVHLAKAKLRLGSSALTLGHANPILSVAEDVLTITISVAAIVVPAIALAFVLLIAWLVLRRRFSAAPS